MRRGAGTFSEEAMLGVFASLRGVSRLAAFLASLACCAGLVVVHRAFADAPLLSKADSIRVLTLGDSITAGVAAGGGAAENGGYRGVLGELLAQDGYRAVFVGTRYDYSAQIENRAHDGWPGYVLRSFPADPGPGQLYGSLTRQALQETRPDVVLLMAGTNDLLRLQRSVAGYTMPNILESMNLLLGEIFSDDPQVRVIVAPVVSSPRIAAASIDAFNAGLVPIVERYARSGDRISLATAMEQAVPRDVEHFPDGIHPSSDGGYADVARAWVQAIEQVTAASTGDPVAKR